MNRAGVHIVNSDRILIVEDNAISGMSLKMQLNRSGFLVLDVVSSGEEALHSVTRFQEQRPDIVLMDIELAGSMDGIDAAMRIRQEHGIPIIFMTADAKPEVRQRAAACQPEAYITKPVVMLELVEHINRVLRVR
ncbi:MAG: response regulator [Leptospiraceae bacterium]|nr:response regulator [Leptospiraceae bacterium]MCB1315503.1 response regulator [Leptospiraceae bacterium]